jgi:UDP-glucose 4-epimerase
MNLAGCVVAVSGSKGFVGTPLVRRLLALGAQIRELTLEDGIDITDWKRLESLDHFDVFVHLAARTFIPDSFALPRETLHANLIGTLNVLEACRRHSAKIVFASTYVYGEPQSLPICEEHPVVALNPYTESKILCERLCACYHRDFGLRCAILRAFNIYGPGQDARFLVPSIIAQARCGKITLQNGKPRRDFIYVEDVAEAYASAIHSERDDFGVYNIGSGVSHPVSEIAEMIRRKANPNSEITYSSEARKGEVFETVADITRAKACLGWQPRTALEQGIENCIHSCS